MVKRARNSRRVNTSIISTIANPIATKELLARLLALVDTLSATDQTETPQDYASIAADLANKKLLHHSNKAVLAYACCGLADILRLYAPDAPYTHNELSGIFKAFFAQFSNLWDQLNPSYLQQCYVLKRLVEVRLIILVVDLPDAPDLISQLFDTMFLVASKGFPEKLEHLACEMLAEVFSEAESVPQKVVMLLLKKLTATPESGLTTSTSNISNPGLAFSLAVCEANVDKMSRYVAQLFSEMLDESARVKNGATDYEASYLALEKIHAWSVQIWRYVPELLNSVMGLINDELNSDSERVRLLSTSTIGNMLASSPEASPESNLVHFINTHKITWQNWLKVSSDISPIVRAKWVEQVPGILCSQSVTSDMTTELCTGFTKCLADINERVRFATCRALELLPFSIFSSKVCTEDTLTTLFRLSREKNSDIHDVTIRVLADVYNTYSDLRAQSEVVDFGNLSEEEVKKVERMLAVELPNVILQLNYVNDKSLTATVDICLFEKLVPFREDSLKRVSRLCAFYDALDDRSKASYFAIVTRQKKFADALQKFLDLALENLKNHSIEGEDKENQPTEDTKDQMRSKTNKTIEWLTASFPPGLRSLDCLERFFQMRNARLIKLISKCISSDTDFKSVKNSLKELLVKFNDSKTLKIDNEKNSITASDMVSTMKILLYRSSNIFFNKTNTSELIKISKELSHKYQEISNELINRLSSIFPDVFKNQIKVLSDLIVVRKVEIEDSLIQSYSHFIKKYPEFFPEDSEFAESLQLIATEGSPHQARYAVKIIGYCDRKELFFSNIAEKVLPLKPSSPLFATHLSALAEIYLIEPLVLGAHSNDISTVIVDEVLRKNRLKNLKKEYVTSEEWITDAQLREGNKELSALNEKLLSIRLIVNRVRSVVNDNSDLKDLGSVLEKPLKLLTTIVTNSGEIVKSKPDLLPTPPCFQQRLRLESGLNILKLARYPSINLLINNSVISILSRLLHDKSSQVRANFLESLEKKLTHNAISERFLHLIFFVGHDPDDEIKRNALLWIASNFRRCEERNDIVYERVLARLIHAIAHEDRFTRMMNDVKGDEVQPEVDAYAYALSYISMYLDSIAKEENISLLYYVASRVKQYRDGQVDPELYAMEDLPDAAVNLYRITELCQLMIKELADSKGWNLQTWPGKMKLPSDLFAPMDDYQEAQKVISRIYIPDDVQIELRQTLKKPTLRFNQKRKAHTLSTAPPRKRISKSKVSRNPKSTRTHKSKAAKKNESDDEEEETESLQKEPRRSTRTRATVKYTEAADSEDNEGESEESSDGSDSE
ncbi:CIC11C00000000785 [Sungouiella intermedia]|uniref:CIC11C00000000785 n=1 Tax=Sungouiella intermedia TaxID=45354 RepID=A0A1L0BVG2_9ASCO|nr:CIC11C00000000785 [[Candida] intermedia]